jgi:dihydrodipicolinate synthase/N-acetylneuraminate lyase
MANLNPAWTMEWWAAIERGDWAEADRRTEYAKGLIAEWEMFTGHLTASAALAKLCARVGILPEMSLAVRPPYRAGTESDVEVLRNLIDEKYPALAWQR